MENELIHIEIFDTTTKSFSKFREFHEINMERLNTILQNTDYADQLNGIFKLQEEIKAKKLEKIELLLERKKRCDEQKPYDDHFMDLVNINNNAPINFVRMHVRKSRDDYKSCHQQLQAQAQQQTQQQQQQQTQQQQTQQQQTQQQQTQQQLSSQPQQQVTAKKKILKKKKKNSANKTNNSNNNNNNNNDTNGTSAATSTSTNNSINNNYNSRDRKATRNAPNIKAKSNPPPYLPQKSPFANIDVSKPKSAMPPKAGFANNSNSNNANINANNNTYNNNSYNSTNNNNSNNDNNNCQQPQQPFQAQSPRKGANLTITRPEKTGGIFIQKPSGGGGINIIKKNQ